MPDHRGQRSLEYVRPLVYEERPVYSSDGGTRDSLDGFLHLLLTIAVCVAVWKLIRGKETFSDSEMEAFRRAKKVREDLAEVQTIVAPPKPPQPDISIAYTKKSP